MNYVIIYKFYSKNWPSPSIANSIIDIRTLFVLASNEVQI